MNSKFNRVFFDGEWLDGFQIIETEYEPIGVCRRCGEEFAKKYKEQIFCSRKCVSRYRNKMNEMEEKYDKKFKDWLDKEIDYSYAPERF